MGFLDFYIIPLAKKLSDCGVFGVSSDEYLNYAVRNREEWELKGQHVVANMESGSLAISDVQYLVLDEADTIFEGGFVSDVHEIWIGSDGETVKRP